MSTRVHEPVEWGVVPCVDCGKVHFSWYDPSRPGFAPTWKAPADGHPYRPMGAKELGALMVDKYGIVLERLAIGEALETLREKLRTRYPEEYGDA